MFNVASAAAGKAAGRLGTGRDVRKAPGGDRNGSQCGYLCRNIQKRDGRKKVCTYVSKVKCRHYLSIGSHRADVTFWIVGELLLHADVQQKVG